MQKRGVSNHNNLIDLINFKNTKLKNKKQTLILSISIITTTLILSLIYFQQQTPEISLSPDITGDKIVNILDQSAVKNCLFKPLNHTLPNGVICARADIDNNGRINILDQNIVKQNIFGFVASCEYIEGGINEKFTNGKEFPSLHQCVSGSNTLVSWSCTPDNLNSQTQIIECELGCEVDQGPNGPFGKCTQPTFTIPSCHEDHIDNGDGTCTATITASFSGSFTSNKFPTWIENRNAESVNDFFSPINTGGDETSSHALRGFLRFDTSSISQTSTIESANLKLGCERISPPSNFGFIVFAVKGTFSGTQSPGWFKDFEGWNPTGPYEVAKLHDIGWPTSNFIEDQYCFDENFNADGIASINSEGETNIVLLSDFDINGVDPDPQPLEFASFYYYDQEPMLEITYKLPPYCGDGIQEGSEECDGADFGTASCTTEGFTSGELTCSESCEITTNNCIEEQVTTPTSPIPNDYVAYYKFDGSPSEVIIDESGSHNGQVVPGIFPSTISEYITREGALFLSGYVDRPNIASPWTPDYFIEIPDHNDFSPSIQPLDEGSFSVSFWAKVPTNAPPIGSGSCDGAGSTIISKVSEYGTDNGEWSIQIDRNDFICFLAGSAGNLQSAGRKTQITPFSNDGKWHHFVFKAENVGGWGYVDGTLSTYIDGELISTETDSLNMQNTVHNVQIGGRIQANAFYGQIDDLVIYKRALSEQEITDMYNEPRSGSSECGNGICSIEIGEIFETCPDDCSTCRDGTPIGQCSQNQQPLYCTEIGLAPNCLECGCPHPENMACDSIELTNFIGGSCTSTGPFCGDQICQTELGEYLLTCPQDCNTCIDGTELNTCSQNKPMICQIDGSLLSDSSTCGCPDGQQQIGSGLGSSCRACSDGTLFRQCSTSQPLYCNDNFELIGQCQSCGCPFYPGYPLGAQPVLCQPDGSCPFLKCEDGTLINSCSTTQPLWCNSFGELIAGCGDPYNCGCPQGDECLSDLRSCSGSTFLGTSRKRTRDDSFTIPTTHNGQNGLLNFDNGEYRFCNTRNQLITNPNSCEIVQTNLVPSGFLEYHILDSNLQGSGVSITRTPLYPERLLNYCQDLDNIQDPQESLAFVRIVLGNTNQQFRSIKLYIPAGLLMLQDTLRTSNGLEIASYNPTTQEIIVTSTGSIGESYAGGISFVLVKEDGVTLSDNEIPWGSFSQAFVAEDGTLDYQIRDMDFNQVDGTAVSAQNCWRGGNKKNINDVMASYNTWVNA